MRPLALALLLLTPLAAPAGDWRRVLEADLGGYVRPEGLQFSAAASLQRDWGGTPGAPSAYLQSGLLTGLTPAYGFGGLFLEVQPAPVLVLRAEAQGYRFFGDSASLLSFARPTDPFGRQDLLARRGQEETGQGRRLRLQATPQGQVGQVVARYQASAAWWRFEGRGPWFFEQEYDTLLRDGDRTFDQLLFVGWAFEVSGLSLFAGPMAQDTRAREAGLVRRRLGLALSWESGDARGRWGRVRGGVAVGRNTSDRNRGGETWGQGSLGTAWSWD